MKDLSIIIVNWNTKDFLRECLQSILTNISNITYEIIVIDNNSYDGSAKMVRECFPQVKLIANQKNEGFAKANNQGYKLVTGRFILLLNPDTLIHPYALKRMVEYADRDPKIGALGCKFLGVTGETQHYYRRFPTLATAIFFYTTCGRTIDNWLGRKHYAHYFFMDADLSDVTEVDQIGASCLLLRKNLTDKIGLFDEQFRIFFNDVDLCKRIKDKGYKIKILPEVSITHYGGEGIKQMSQESYWLESAGGLCRYFQKHVGKTSSTFVKRLILIDKTIVLLALLILCLITLNRMKREIRKRQIQSVRTFIKHWIYDGR